MYNPLRIFFIFHSNSPEHVESMEHNLVDYVQQFPLRISFIFHSNSPEHVGSMEHNLGLDTNTTIMDAGQKDGWIDNSSHHQSLIDYWRRRGWSCMLKSVSRIQGSFLIVCVRVCVFVCKRGRERVWERETDRQLDREKERGGRKDERGRDREREK